ncbi:MAG: hypothetical protein M1833_003058 [Piccolia ochrophora]|nr:MAG: hypothetical protein M1833_003058 [Piccolia ochrophora]
MDIAYDHIQEEVLSPDVAPPKETTDESPPPTLNTEFAQAYKAISSSPWGAKFGAFVGNVRKQGETAFEEARQQTTAAGSQASKGLTDIVNRARAISVTSPELTSTAPNTSGATQEPSSSASSTSITKDGAAAERSNSDTLNDATRMLSRFRSEAVKRLKDIEKAEEAADEALLKFGTNISNFLRDAVTIAPPEEGGDLGPTDKTKVLFESKDHEGKRVIHTTRFDAQLHVIHSTLDSFLKDPGTSEFSKWKEGFEVEKKTEDISADLEKYKELRTAMEKIVPDRVKYEDFWTRYYFLRHVIETEEQRRKELLKGAAAPTTEEDIAWDEEDSEPETAHPSSANATTTASSASATNDKDIPNPTSSSPDSSTTIDPTTSSSATFKPPPTELAPGRKSNDQNSQPDSDASYDVVSGAPSGAPSHAPGSPRADRKQGGDESDEEDWE